MMDTSLDKEGWDRVRERLPRVYRSQFQNTEKKSIKIKEMGGMVMELRKEFITRKDKKEINKRRNSSRSRKDERKEVEYSWGICK